MMKLSSHLMNIKIYSSIREIEDIEFYDNCFIIPLEIIIMIEKCGFLTKLSKYARKILAKSEDIFLFHDQGIEIGNLNYQTIFVQKYIILYILYYHLLKFFCQKFIS